jgi:aspartate kinase
MEKIKIGGIMQSDGRALVRVLAVPQRAEMGGLILGAMAQAQINVELVVQAFDIEETGNYTLVMAQKDLDHALGVLEELKSGLEAKGITYVPDVAVISVFGPHLREKPLVPGAMFNALSSVGIGSLAIATSISSVSSVVEGHHLDQAVEALNEVFDAPFQVKKRPKDY